MHEVGEDLRGRADGKGIQLELECDDSMPDAVTSDPVRVRQILVNLIDNIEDNDDTQKVYTNADVDDDALAS